VLFCRSDLCNSFYPGIASPLAGLRIGAGSAGWSPNGAIDAPASGLPTHSNVTIDPDAPTPLRPAVSRPTRVVGSFEHAVLPMPPVRSIFFSVSLHTDFYQRKTVIPAMDFLSCYAIAVNEVNAGGGRIVTSPTNGAAGVIPAVLKYILEVRTRSEIDIFSFSPISQFVSDDPEKSVITFLLTASVGSTTVHRVLHHQTRRYSRLSACYSNVGAPSPLPRVGARQRSAVCIPQLCCPGWNNDITALVACSMASAGFAACMGGMSCPHLHLMNFLNWRDSVSRNGVAGWSFLCVAATLI
jgi:hypothetical protein